VRIRVVVAGDADIGKTNEIKPVKPRHRDNQNPFEQN